MTTEPVSLLELNRRVSRALLSAPGLTGVWVTGETSDLRVSGGHCYMELLQKDDNGRHLPRHAPWCGHRHMPYWLHASKPPRGAGCAQI